MPSGSQQHLLHDQQIVRVFLPMRGGGSLPLEGAVKQVSPSFMEVFFPPGKFPGGHLREEGDWLLIWERGANVLSAKARLDRRLEESRVRLEITGLFLQTSERRYPRVAADVYLRYWPAWRQEQAPRLAQRQRVTLSGCGLRFHSEEAFAVDEQVGLELSLPASFLEVVRCLGKVVWVQAADSGHDLAVDLVQITRQDLDKILNFCILEQFRQMRSKVRVMGSVLSPILEGLNPEGESV